MIDPKTREEALQKGTFYSFIPQRLTIKERPELSNFPLNVMFASFIIKNGIQTMGSALYEPDFSTYLQVDKNSSMQYRNVYGGDSKILITYDRSNRSWEGRKFVKGKSIDIADGPNWKSFFVHFTSLGLSNGERCKFEEVAEILQNEHKVGKQAEEKLVHQNLVSKIKDRGRKSKYFDKIFDKKSFQVMLRPKKIQMPQKFKNENNTATDIGR